MIKDEDFMLERIPKVYFYMNLVSAVNGGRKENKRPFSATLPSTQK